MVMVKLDKEASQTHPSVAVALSRHAPWRGAARPDPSRDKNVSLRMTSCQNNLQSGAAPDMIREP